MEIKISEEILPLDVWEEFCKKFGAKPVPRIRFDGEKMVQYDDGSREFTLRLSFLGKPEFFEMESEMFLEYN